MSALAHHELTGQTAVVTGSSSGIGRAIALELAAAGADIVVHARASRDAAEVVVDAVAALGRRAKLLLADLAEPTAAVELVERAFAWQPVDIWVNNAGTDVLTGTAANWPFARKLEQLWRVDVVGTITLSRDAGRRMAERGRGVIVNMGWDQVAHGMAGDSGELFTATKAAVMAFSRSLARSLAPEVRVNCLAPGWIRTTWGERASAAWQQRALDESLLSRWGTPEDVARACCFLVSPAADFITGQVLEINGGSNR